MEGTSFFLSLPAGGRLHAIEWQPTAGLPQNAPLVMVLPGRAEPAAKYAETAQILCGMGFAVWAIDWRGQGLSERHPDPAISRRGHLETFDQLADDLSSLFAFQRQHSIFGNRRVLVLAHSMGGAIFLRWLQRCSLSPQGPHNGPGPAAAFLVAPMIAIPTWGHSPLLARLLARLAVIAGKGSAYALGQHGWGLGSDCQFDGNRRTSCPHRFAREVALLHGRPDLRTGGPTWRWLDQAFALTKALSQPWSTGYPSVPLRVVVGAEDAYASYQAQQTFFARFPAASLVQIPQARHEVLMEQDGPRQALWADFSAFITSGALGLAPSS